MTGLTEQFKLEIVDHLTNYRRILVAKGKDIHDLDLDIKKLMRTATTSN